MVLDISLSQEAACLKPLQLYLPICWTFLYLCIKQQQLLKHDNVTEKQESKYALASMLYLMKIRTIRAKYNIDQVQRYNKCSSII